MRWANFPSSIRTFLVCVSTAPGSGLISAEAPGAALAVQARSDLLLHAQGAAPSPLGSTAISGRAGVGEPATRGLTLRAGGLGGWAAITLEQQARHTHAQLAEGRLASCALRSQISLPN